MIGDKKKSHRYIVFFIHQNLDISECRIQVPQVNFVREFGIHFSSFIPLLCRNLKMFPDYSRSQGGTRPRFTCQRGSMPPPQSMVCIHPMLTSTTYISDHQSSQKKSISDLAKQNQLSINAIVYVILNTSQYLQSRHF